MRKFTNPLNNIKIASPCSADWDQMSGDERKRFCGECKLNVYNLSGMTRTEAEDLIAGTEGRLCVRFYRRTDGTVLTKDCPVGWAAVKRRVSRIATAAASMVFGIFAGVGFSSYFNQEEKYQRTMGTMVKTPPQQPLMGDVSFNDVEMGKMQTVPDNISIAGGITNIDEVRKDLRKSGQR